MQQFVVRRNVIFECAKCNQKQKENKETVDKFITALYCLAEHCGYRALHDEMIGARLVVGLEYKNLLEQLQMDAELTLHRAVTCAQQSQKPLKLVQVSTAFNSIRKRT